MKTKPCQPTDPLIDEVRRRRERLVSEHGGLRGWVEYLRRLQKHHPERIISLGKTARRGKKVARTPGSAKGKIWIADDFCDPMVLVPDVEAKPTLRDRMWLWAHEAGSQDRDWGLPAPSRMTPTEAALYLGIPNVIMVVYQGKPEPPFDQHALAMIPLKRVVWSIVGDSSSKRNDEKTDLEEVVGLAGRFPNIAGAMMDDFFHEPNAQGAIARYSVEALAAFRRRLHAAARPLDLWVVLYSHQLHLPVARHLAECDVVTFWTWRAEDLSKLEANFARFEAIVPAARRVLGCYMWDYGTRQPMPLALFQQQYHQGMRWLRERRIEGMIFLATCICDLGIDTVEWLRRELAELRE